MENNSYVDMFKSTFQFLIEDYHFGIISQSDEEWGHKMVLKNATTGVEIIYEVREAYINIMLYRLLNGEIRENTSSAIRNNETINGFNLDYIVNIRNPNDLIRPAYEYGEYSEFHEENYGLYKYISKFSDNIKKHAEDILNGDFDLFNQLDKVVKESYGNK